MTKRVAILTLLIWAINAQLASAANVPSDVYLTLDQAVRVSVGWGVPHSNASLSGKELSIGTRSSTMRGCWTAKGLRRA